MISFTDNYKSTCMKILYLWSVGVFVTLALTHYNVIAVENVKFSCEEVVIRVNKIHNEVGLPACERPWNIFVLCECLQTCVFSCPNEDYPISEQRMFEIEQQLYKAYDKPMELWEIPLNDAKNLLDNIATHTIGLSVNLSMPVVTMVVNRMRHDVSVITSSVMSSVFKGWYLKWWMWVLLIFILVIVACFIIIIIYKILKCSVLFAKCSVCTWSEYRRVGSLIKDINKDKLTRIHSDVKYDEYGPYVAHKHYRIYSNGQAIPLLPTAPTFNAVSSKESPVYNSSIEIVDKLPKFVGQFFVGNRVVGHFSRINRGGKSCLLTAAHILSAHHLSDLRIGCNGKTLPFNFKWKVVAYSPCNALDLIMFEVPTANFSALGLALGVLEKNVGMRIGVCLYGEYDGNIGLSLGNAVYADKAFRIKYGASTIPSWSGTPILTSRGRIIGVHTDGGNGKYNIGSLIPPGSKESEYFGEMMTMMHGMDEGDVDAYYEDDVQYMIKHRGKTYNIYAEQEYEMTFQRLMEEVENDEYDTDAIWKKAREEDLSEDEYEEQRNKNYFGMKETLVTCIYCQTIQRPAKKCGNCKFVLNPSIAKKQVDKEMAEIREIFPSLPPAYKNEIDHLLPSGESAQEDASKITNFANLPYNLAELVNSVNIMSQDFKEFKDNVNSRFNTNTKLVSENGKPVLEVSSMIKEGWPTVIKPKFVPININKTMLENTVSELKAGKKKRRRNKKETVDSSPLNCFAAPLDASCGAIALNGNSRKSAAIVLKPSAVANVSSEIVKEQKKVNSTLNLKQLTQQSSSMLGHKEEQKLKKLASFIKQIGL